MTWYLDHIWEEFRTRQLPDDDLLDEIVMKHSPGLREFYEGRMGHQPEAPLALGEKEEENHNGE